MNGVKMRKKTATLFTDPENYEKYKQYCGKNDLISSKSLKFMENELKNQKEVS